MQPAGKGGPAGKGVDMIYELPDGRRIDTARELSFEERNFLQKMLIYHHLGLDLAEFRKKWRREGNPVWKGEECPAHPTPAVRILLDLERRISSREP